jgi:hypothetical protein
LLILPSVGTHPPTTKTGTNYNSNKNPLRKKGINYVRRVKFRNFFSSDGRLYGFQRIGRVFRDSDLKRAFYKKDTNWIKEVD